ncbi:MAG: type II secretion system protein [Armatimonadota bacterium]|nr:type II secretion system protein [Armatimonadota bacterium]
MLRNNRGQLLLIEILVVVAILMLIGYFIIPRYLGERSSPEEGTVAGPKERAESVECMNNLRNIRAAIEMYRQTGEGKFPTTLAELESSGVSESIRKCPVSGKEYKYDPSTGTVSCTYPGHERY